MTGNPKMASEQVKWLDALVGGLSPGTLSRWRHGFEPRWGCQSGACSNRAWYTEPGSDQPPVVHVDRGGQLPQHGLDGGDLSMSQGVGQSTLEGGDLVAVGSFRSLLLDVVDLVVSSPELAEPFGQLLQSGSALGRRHRPVLEGGEVPVDRRLGLLDLRFNPSALVLDLAVEGRPGVPEVTSLLVSSACSVVHRLVGRT